MAEEKKISFIERIGGGNTFVALGLVGILMMMIMPLPSLLMDVLIGANIAIAMMIIMTAVFTKKPLDFSIFPSLLLITALFRLSLNIATTRLILLKGHEGTQSAGEIINTFGNFVVGGNFAVGVVVFIILVIINFMVITKGSGRIAEVAARFTLDAMPGKQMAIDADLNAGLVNEAEAKIRRKEVTQEADFYGAMDGASKFVRGDAIAGILITIINIVGGLFIGTIQNDLSLSDAASIYSLLTIGDGLVSQIPALIISTSAGVIVTRAATGKEMGTELSVQLTGNSKAMYLVAIVLFFFGLIPGMPFLVFCCLSGAIAFFGSKNSSTKTEEKKQEIAKVEQAMEQDQMAAAPSESEKIEAMLPIDLLELEVGYSLIPLVDVSQGGELLDRIQAIRRQFAGNLGMIVPPIHIRDNLQLDASDYRLMMKGIEVAKGSLTMGYYMAMNPGDVIEEIEGIDTVEPAFGLPAKWIPEDDRDQAEAMGYTVVDCATVVATHISEVVKRNAADLLGRPELQRLLDILSKNNQALIEELIPEKLSLAEVLAVCKNLLREQVSIRDLRSVLETLADNAASIRNIEILTELTRQNLSYLITSKYKHFDGKL
jgi:flagellar biosynthesis protein FlhA